MCFQGTVREVTTSASAWRLLLDTVKKRGKRCYFLGFPCFLWKTMLECINYVLFWCQSHVMHWEWDFPKQRRGRIANVSLKEKGCAHIWLYILWHKRSSKKRCPVPNLKAHISKAFNTEGHARAPSLCLLSHRTIPPYNKQRMINKAQEMTDNIFISQLHVKSQFKIMHRSTGLLE